MLYPGNEKGVCHPECGSGRKKAVALEARLRDCPSVRTLGVRPNFSDYSQQEAALIRGAEKIYYPSTHYVDMFAAMGKSTFPSVHTYHFVQDKIKQSSLFELLQVPIPRTRFFFGRGKAEKISRCFDFPFVAKIARGSALGRGVFLIQNRDELENYCAIVRTAYIQQYLPIDRDVRVVVIGERIRHAYWRIGAPGRFANNVDQGGRIRLGDVPQKVLELAADTARRCGWNDVGLDICLVNDHPYVLEANMKYGKQGFREAGINYADLMEELIGNGEI
ncbi:MAG: RimK family alpha-L-glutamate ligase [Desulfosalsimonadaceae bacterium]